LAVLLGKAAANRLNQFRRRYHLLAPSAHLPPAHMQPKGLLPEALVAVLTVRVLLVLRPLLGLLPQVRAPVAPPQDLLWAAQPEPRPARPALRRQVAKALVAVWERSSLGIRQGLLRTDDAFAVRDRPRGLSPIIERFFLRTFFYILSLFFHHAWRGGLIRGASS